MKEGRRPPAALTIAFILALGAAYLVAFWRRLLIQGLVPIDGDMMRLVFPTWSIGHRLFSQSSLPLWDLYRNMGCPFLADPSNQALYPLHRLLPLSHFLDFLRLYVVGHVLLAAVPSYLLARRWGLSRFAGALAVVGVCFNGFALARMTTTVAFGAYAWAPLALYALQRRRPVGLAFTLAFQWLAGFPTFSLMTGLLLVIAAAADDDPVAAFRCAMVGGVLGAGLAAVQLVPFADLLSRSTRPVLITPEAASHVSLHPRELIRPLLVPSLFLTRLPKVTGSDPAVIGFYLGPVLLALAAGSAAVGGRRERVFAGAALACFILTLGSRLPCYRFIPGINLFRFPAHWLFPAVVLTSLAAAGAVDRFRSTSGRAITVALVALDLLIYAWPAHVAWAEPGVLDEKPQQFSLLGPEVPAGRVFFEPALIDMSAQWRMRSTEDWVKVLRMGLPSIGAGYGVREVASRHQLPLTTQVRFVERLSGLRADDAAFDHAGVTAIVRLSTTVAGIPGAEAFHVTANPDAKAAAFFENEGRVLQIHEGADSFSVEAEGPGRLVLSQAYDPGWRASEDGKNAPVDVFEAAFPSVTVPAGRHLVRFSYRPASFLVGLALSILSLLGAIAFWYASMRKGKT